MSATERLRSFNRTPSSNGRSTSPPDTSSSSGGDRRGMFRRQSSTEGQHGIATTSAGDGMSYPSTPPTSAASDSAPFRRPSAPSHTNPPSTSARKVSAASSAIPRRPSSSSASLGAHGRRMSNDSSWSAHTAAQSPVSSPSTPKTKFASRSKILASSASAMDTSPNAFPFNSPSWRTNSGEGPLARSVSPSSGGKGAIMSNMSSGGSIMERKKRLASSSGSNAFDDGMTDTSSNHSKSTRIPSGPLPDQAFVSSTPSTPATSTSAHRMPRVDQSSAAEMPALPTSASQEKVSAAIADRSPISFKSRLFGLRRDRRQSPANLDDVNMPSVSGEELTSPMDLPSPSDPTAELAARSEGAASRKGAPSRSVHQTPPPTANTPARSLVSAHSRPSTAGALSTNDSFGTPSQGKSPARLPSRMNSSSSLLRRTSGSQGDLAASSWATQGKAGGGGSTSSPTVLRKLGSAAELDADLSPAHSPTASMYFAASGNGLGYGRSKPPLRTHHSSSSDTRSLLHREATDYGQDNTHSADYIPRRPRANSRGSASIRSVGSFASHMSSSSVVPIRTTSLNKRAVHSPDSPRRSDLISPSSSYKSVSYPHDMRASGEEGGAARRGVRASWRQSSTLAAAAGPSGAVALAAIRASFGEPLRQLDVTDSTLALGGDRNASAIGLRIGEPANMTAEEDRSATLSKLTGEDADEGEEVMSANDSARPSSLLGQPLRPSKSPLRSNYPSSALSESGHGFRSVSAPMSSRSEGALRRGVRPPQQMDQLSPPRKSLEEMGIVDAVYRRGEDMASSGSFSQLTQSTSQKSLSSQERESTKLASSAARKASVSSTSLTTDEETEGGHDDASTKAMATPRTAARRLKNLRKVTPPALSMFRSHSKHHAALTTPEAEGSASPAAEQSDTYVAPSLPSGSRKKSIWRLGSGNHEHSHDVPPLPTMTTKSKLSMSIRGRRSEPPVPARLTIRRVFEDPAASDSLHNVSGSVGDSTTDLSMSDAASTVVHENLAGLAQSSSRESLPRTNGHGSPGALGFTTPGTPQTPSDKIPAHLKLLVRRSNAIRELVDTERSYASDLAVIRDIYLTRARALAGFPSASPSQTPSFGPGTPIPSPALIGTPTSAPAFAPNYMPVKGTPPMHQQWSRTVSHKLSSDASLASASPSAGQPPSNASAAGASSAPSNRSSTYTTSSHASSDLSFHWPPSGNSLPGTPPIGPGGVVHKGTGLVAGSPALSAQPHHQQSLQHIQRAALSKLHTTSSVPQVASGDPPLSASDIRVIFASLESCCTLAQEMASMLQAAMGSTMRDRPQLNSRTISTNLNSDDDRVGQLFLTVMPRIETVYTAYCSRHEASMQRLQVLNTTSTKAANFLRDCTEVARKQTTAWDLASLLIKPVQRVLKYPLLLRQILTTTDPLHPDHAHLTDALDQIQAVADKINQVKRRRDLADHIIAGRDIVKGVASSPMSAAPNKIRKKGGAPRSSYSNGETLLTDSAMDGAMEQYNTIFERFEALQNRVGLFGSQCGTWTHALRDCYYAQLRIMGCLRRVYSLRFPDEEAAALSHSRPAPVGPEDEVVAAYMDVLKTIINRSWRQMDTEVRSAILPMTAKVEGMFEAPRAVIAKRDEREADFLRCRAVMQLQDDGSSGVKGLDRKMLESANGFVALQAQLIDELPIFLQGVQVLLDVGVQAFARLQAAHLDEVRNLTLDFWSDKAGHSEEVDMVGVDDEDMLSVGPTLRHINPVRAFWDSHRPFSQWSESLLISRRESELSVINSVDIDDVDDLDLHDGKPDRHGEGRQGALSLATAGSSAHVFTSPFEQKGTGKVPPVAAASSSGHSSGSGPAFLPVPGGRRPSGGGVAGLMRTLSGTFSRDNTPSPTASANVAPPLPGDAASNVAMHRATTGGSLQPQQTVLTASQDHSDSTEHGSAQDSMAQSGTVATVAPFLPSLVFRNDEGEGNAGDGFFIQNKPIAFLDSKEQTAKKEPYGVSPSIRPINKQRLVAVPADDVELSDSEDENFSGDMTRSNSFVSAESARSRLLHSGSIDAAMNLQSANGDKTITQANGALALPRPSSPSSSSAASSSHPQMVLPQRHKMQTLFRCIALQDAARPAERQDHLGWPFMRYVSGDTFRVLSTTENKATSDRSLLFGRLDRTGELGWVDKAHFSNLNIGEGLGSEA